VRGTPTGFSGIAHSIQKIGNNCSMCSMYIYNLIFIITEKCVRRGGSFTDGTYKDGLCHGMNNIYECDFDGGDCCLPVTYHAFCETSLQTCDCHLMGMMAPGLLGHSQMEGKYLMLFMFLTKTYWLGVI
jgi:hypothetical protein